MLGKARIFGLDYIEFEKDEILHTDGFVQRLIEEKGKILHILCPSGVIGGLQVMNSLNYVGCVDQFGFYGCDIIFLFSKDITEDNQEWYEVLLDIMEYTLLLQNIHEPIQNMHLIVLTNLSDMFIKTYEKDGVKIKIINVALFKESLKKFIKDEKLYELLLEMKECLENHMI